jgi:hypothetical protein
MPSSPYYNYRPVRLHDVQNLKIAAKIISYDNLPVSTQAYGRRPVFAVLFFVVFAESAPKVPTSTPKLLLGRCYWPLFSMEAVKKI